MLKPIIEDMGLLNKKLESLAIDLNKNKQVHKNESRIIRKRFEKIEW